MSIIAISFLYDIDFCSSAAYKVNADKEFDKQPPVYAMLTDLHDFYILRYDGSTFSLYQDEITVPQRPRSAFLHGMINGSLTVTFVSRIVVDCHSYRDFVLGYFGRLYSDLGGSFHEIKVPGS